MPLRLRQEAALKGRRRLDPAAPPNRNPSPVVLPPFEIRAFRLLAADDPHDPRFPNWSRAYEWDYVLRALAAAHHLTVHNTCCGWLDGHALFHDALVARCPRTVNSDLELRDRNRAFQDVFRYDLREPLHRQFDVVLCISTIEEIHREARDPALVQTILANLLAQTRPGGRLIVTCDVSTPDKPVYDLSGAVEIGLLERILGSTCARPGRPLTGFTSAFPEPLYADLQVCLLDLVRGPAP